MPDLFDAFGFDKELAKGKWFTVRGIKVKLAFMKSTEIVYKTNKKKEEILKDSSREPTVEEAEQIGIEFFAENVLLDWDKDLTIKGEKIPCTLENKIKILNEYELFQSKCFEIAQDNFSFQEKKIEERVKK